MAEQLRLSSSSPFPPSTPLPRATPFSRPDWPWANRTYSHQASQSSLHSSTTSNHQSSWDTRSTVSSSTIPLPGQSTPRNTPMQNLSATSARESTRQWSFVGFEWVVRDVHRLNEYIESIETEELDKPSEHNFEVLKESPMLGEDKFKLEIARVSDASESHQTNRRANLSLFITSLTMDFAHHNYELSAAMMAAIKCQDDRVGQRGARPEWVWEHWQNDWVFRRDREVWSCPLPSLSKLLENSQIQETDSLVICIQIHCPIGPLVPHQPSVYHVPKDLLDGLEASLDNPNTGDVRFVCLERIKPDARTSPGISPEAATPTSQSPSISSSTGSFATETTARKRVIYAHADILTRRSEYFATMLASSFAENPGVTPGERKLYTVVVEEADFETIYWLLKFCYANWLLFQEEDDPRLAVDSIGAGWSAKGLTTRGGEWEWQTFRKGSAIDDTLSSEARSVTSLSTEDRSHVLPSTHKSFQTDQPAASTSLPAPRSNNSTLKASIPTSTSRQTPTTPRRNVTVPLSVPSGTSSSRGKASTAEASYQAPSHYTHVPPRQPHPVLMSTPDPHPHPTPAPRPASALSIYQIAHRYSMPNLASLALEHMMSTITPQSSFALLLATSLWEELHSIVEDYVVEKWDEVSVSEEFEHCCQEVAAGEWGPDGGKTLMTLFRRLRSPNTAMFTRV